jgi:outer membrane lipoprotein-sorting protein
MMEKRENFNPDNLLDRAVDAVLRDAIASEPPPERVAQLIAAVERAANQPAPSTLLERIKNMRLRTQIAVAAVALLALLGLVSWLVPGTGVPMAFADVAEALTKVRSATWKTMTEVKGPDNKTHKWSGIGMFLAPSRERTEITADGKTSVTIMDGEKDKVLSLDPAAKTATIINLKNLPREGPYGRTFQDLRELVAAAHGGKGRKVERLPAEMIDGRRTEGFRIQLGAVEVKVWADPKTSLPIRVEEITASPETHIVMTDFQVGADLDNSLFSLDVPVGYTVQNTMQLDFSKKPIAYVAEALKMAAEFNGGVFPPALRGEQGIDGITQRGMIAWSKEHAKDPPDQQRAKVLGFAMKLGGALGFLFSLPPDSVHYAGKDVKLNTPDRPIFWCAAPGQMKSRQEKELLEIQVIYADLSIREMSAEKAAKVLPPK